MVKSQYGSLYKSFVSDLDNQVLETNDEEYQKGDLNLLMRNPQLYKLGMQYQCFSKRLFAAWLAYAVWHAYIVYWVVFMVLTQSNYMSTNVQSNGQALGQWLAGNTVYASCIFISNLILIHRSFLIHPFGMFIIFGMVSAFFVIFFIMSS